MKKAFFTRRTPASDGPAAADPLHSCDPNILLARLAAITLICGVFGLILSGAAAGTTPAAARAAAGLTSILFFGAPAVLFWHFSTGATKGIDFRISRWRPVAWAVVAALAIQPLLQAAAFWTQDIFRTFLSPSMLEYLTGIQTERAEAIARIAGDKTPGGFPAVAATLAVLPALCEELFFRATLQRIVLRLTRNGILSITIVSVVFTAIHPDAANAPGIFLCSMLLGYSYRWSGNIWTPIAFHATSNLWNVALWYRPEILPNGFPCWYAVFATTAAIGAIWALRNEKKKTM